MPYSDAYLNCLSVGPFPGRIDPWAEAAKYFHQIHGGMIGNLLERLRIPLLELGYFAMREASLQVTERRQPDIGVRERLEKPDAPSDWNYVSAAAGVLADPGVALENDFPELEAVYIRAIGDAENLVTVIEIISPGNKDTQSDMLEYQERRERLVRSKGVNVVELDLTRSVKRLVHDILATTYAYHIAIHMPKKTSRLIGMDYGNPLKRFALPLRREVVAVENQLIYDTAYLQVSTAIQLEEAGGYTQSKLPFPSLLTEAQRREALEAVEKWRDTLTQLRSEQT